MVCKKKKTKKWNKSKWALIQKRSHTPRHDGYKYEGMSRSRSPVIHKASFSTKEAKSWKDLEYVNAQLVDENKKLKS